MSAPVSRVWWPVLAAAAPVLAPVVAWKAVGFRREVRAAAARNRARLEHARPLELPELEFLEITPLVDYACDEGYLGAPGVSYWIRTNLGSILFDVGFGASRPDLAHNARKLGFTLASADALALSHLHPDHIGGVEAAKHRHVRIPRELGDSMLPVHSPAACTAFGRAACVEAAPRLVAAGIATTGALSRALFIEGGVEEQVLVARVRGKGVVIVTGCGHPGLDVLTEMATRIAPGHVHAIAGGFHYPVTASRWNAPGLELQRLFGTGKPIWSPISDEDVDRAVQVLERVGPERLLISAHDSCDHAIRRFTAELSARVEVLTVGRSVRI